jgi:hypothetical protein
MTSSINVAFAAASDGPPAEYQVAMASLEQRALRGELTLGQAKREIFALRERFAAGSVAAVMQWAAQGR